MFLINARHAFFSHQRERGRSLGKSVLQHLHCSYPDELARRYHLQCKLSLESFTLTTQQKPFSFKQNTAVWNDPSKGKKNSEIHAKEIWQKKSAISGQGRKMQKYQRRQKEKQSLQKDLEINSPGGGFKLIKGRELCGKPPMKRILTKNIVIQWGSFKVYQHFEGNSSSEEGHFPLWPGQRFLKCNQGLHVKTQSTLSKFHFFFFFLPRPSLRSGKETWKHTVK